MRPSDAAHCSLCRGRALRARALRAVLLALVLILCVDAAAWAQKSGRERKEFDGVGITRKHGEAVPLNPTFQTADGETIALEQYFDGETPVVLNLVYHDCPMLCGLMLNGITRTLSNLSWTPGQEFRVLTVSFNPNETPELAREKREIYLKQLGRPQAADGWHWLTGSEASIRALTDAVGFNYRWVAEQQEYAHPTALVFLDGTGTVTRYIYGMEVPSSDVRKALVEASNGTVGNPVDQIAMYCFQFDPEANTYTADAFNLMKLGSILTVVLLGAGLFFFWRRENKALASSAAVS